MTKLQERALVELNETGWRRHLAIRRVLAASLTDSYPDLVIAEWALTLWAGEALDTLITQGLAERRTCAGTIREQNDDGKEYRLTEAGAMRRAELLERAPR